MGKFLKENWVYILLPILLVLAAVLAMIFFGQGDGNGAFSGYEI